MKGNRFRSAIMLSLALVVAGCAQPQIPEDPFYRLTLSQGPATTSIARLNGTVEVGRFIADGVTAGRALVFNRPDQSHEVQAYHYHFWTEPPPIMLQNQLVSFLRSGRVARNVVTPELRIEPEFVISGRIRRFEKTIGTPGRVVAELELGLKDARTDRLVHLKTYRSETSTVDASPRRAVGAFSESVNAIFSQFVRDIANPPSTDGSVRLEQRRESP